ncbi:hypothetical protein PPYR_13820 [Photinus pyralis]|uniref:Uncharacterized protein n=1 Tax=Photinus pyralis TaxID=7054 RepID=A0A5N4AA53_PHOPY|nr:hypothetical protein PPYR_13820 [Photinus pyralis]
MRGFGNSDQITKIIYVYQLPPPSPSFLEIVRGEGVYNSLPLISTYRSNAGYVFSYSAGTNAKINAGFLSRPREVLRTQHDMTNEGCGCPNFTIINFISSVYGAYNFAPKVN